jgi:hypothetical protein
MIAPVRALKKWLEEVTAPAVPTDMVGTARCHTVNVIEGLICHACGKVIPHVDKYETARILFQRT